MISMFSSIHYYIFNVRYRMYTNINIIGEGEIFNYMIEYCKTPGLNDAPLQYILEESRNNVYLCPNSDYVNSLNHWDELYGAQVGNFMPLQYRTGKFYVYFPQHSVETYGGNGIYMLSVSIKIANTSMVLCSKIIRRFDAVACSEIKTYMNQNYYECVDIDIIDPFDIVYGDQWSDFRKHICGEKISNEYINSEGACLYISLHPIQKGEGNEFIKLDKFTGGQNSFSLSNQTDNDLHLHIYTNIDKPLKYGETTSILFNLRFNDVYEGDIQGYILETYGLEDFYIRYGLLVGNSADMYVNISKDCDRSTTCKFTREEINAQNFHNWNGWKEGIYIIGSVDIIDSDGDSILYMVSNKLPLTDELYKYIVKSDNFVINGYTINNVELNQVDMELKHINIVNKIESESNQIHVINSNPSTNIVVPVFYKSVELAETILHPEVIETICINLDNYKSQVDNFLIQIEGIKFQEIGRLSSGVLFKINGNKLPKKLSSGTLYILNQDSELVTSGKYKYVF